MVVLFDGKLSNYFQFAFCLLLFNVNNIVSYKFSSSESHINQPCPVGYVFVQSLNKCFFFSRTMARWRTARDVCVQAGGNLMTLYENSNWNFLKNEFSKHYVKDDLIYIGLSDIIHNGVYEWEKSLNNVNKDGLIEKEIYPYYGDKWCPNEPNGHKAFECVAVRIQTNNIICFEDRNCTLHAYFACELDLTKNIWNNVFQLETINDTLSKTISEVGKYRHLLRMAINKFNATASNLNLINNSMDNNRRPSLRTVLNLRKNIRKTKAYCFAKNQRYNVGQIFKRDECTNCLCISNGSVICENIQCEKLNCTNSSEPVKYVGICCPFCEDEIKEKYSYFLNINNTIQKPIKQQ